MSPPETSAPASPGLGPLQTRVGSGLAKLPPAITGFPLQEPHPGQRISEATLARSEWGSEGLSGRSDRGDMTAKRTGSNGLPWLVRHLSRPKMDARRSIKPVTPTPGLSPQPRFTDFSDYLATSAEVDDGDDGSITVVDPDAFSYTYAEDDMYGWEAELSRKMGMGLANRGGACVRSCRKYQNRRPDGGKRSLLHRLFSSAGYAPGSAPDAGR